METHHEAALQVEGILDQYIIPMIMLVDLLGPCLFDSGISAQIPTCVFGT